MRPIRTQKAEKLTILIMTLIGQKNIIPSLYSFSVNLLIISSLYPGSKNEIGNIR